jgi:hypothetical protein
MRRARPSSATWRGRAAPVVYEVLRQSAGLPRREVRRRLRDAYPFAYRAGYPYRAWLLEVHALYGRLNARRSPPGGALERLWEETDA